MILSAKRLGSKGVSKASRSLSSKGNGSKKAFTIPKDPFMAMKKLSQAASSGKTFTPKELLMFQIKANEFGVHVELVSKVSESANASIRKLQQQG